MFEYLPRWCRAVLDLGVAWGAVWAFLFFGIGVIAGRIDAGVLNPWRFRVSRSPDPWCGAS